MKHNLCDLVTRIRNGIMARHLYVYAKQYSKLQYNICKVFRDEGYIKDVQIVENPYQTNSKGNLKFKTLKITLRYVYPKGLKISEELQKSRENLSEEVKQNTPDIKFLKTRAIKVSNFANSAIVNIKIISKPSKYVYTKANKISVFGERNRFATIIMSTSKGIMTAIQASTMGIGGKVIARIW